MRRALSVAAVCLVFVFGLPLASIAQPDLPPLPRVEQVSEVRIDRLTDWLHAVETHRPGAEDEAVESVRSWSGDDLQTLLTDVTSLITLVVNPRASRFAIRTADSRRIEIGYTRTQLDRLRTLACIASGSTTDERCAAVRSGATADEVLARLADHAAAARRGGDGNYLARRAALLHTDAATLAALTAQPARAGTALGFSLADGRLAGVLSGAEHWAIARAALDMVVPTGATKPAPHRDRMVRDWYVATAAWMEGRLRHSTIHLDRAREIFPDDPDLLFLSGCQHEAYASPEIQEPIAHLARLRGWTFTVHSEQRELADAERFLRRALAIRPSRPDARLRLGHVLLRQRRYDEALREVRSAAERLVDPRLQYYAAMFVGAAAEELGDYGQARSAFEHASTLYPSAQSARTAMSELAWRRGDRAAALTFSDRMLAAADDDPRSDPWWVYYESEVRDPDALLGELRRAAAGSGSH